MCKPNESRPFSAIWLVTGGDVRGAIAAFFGFGTLGAFGLILIGWIRALLLFLCILLGELEVAHG